MGKYSKKKKSLMIIKNKHLGIIHPYLEMTDISSDMLCGSLVYVKTHGLLDRSLYQDLLDQNTFVT